LKDVRPVSFNTLFSRIRRSFACRYQPYKGLCPGMYAAPCASGKPHQEAYRSTGGLSPAIAITEPAESACELQSERCSQRHVQATTYVGPFALLASVHGGLLLLPMLKAFMPLMRWWLLPLYPHFSDQAPAAASFREGCNASGQADPEFNRLWPIAASAPGTTTPGYVAWPWAETGPPPNEEGSANDPPTAPCLFQCPWRLPKEHSARKRAIPTSSRSSKPRPPGDGVSWSVSSAIYNPHHLAYQSRGRSVELAQGPLYDEASGCRLGGEGAQGTRWLISDQFRERAHRNLEENRHRVPGRSRRKHWNSEMFRRVSRPSIPTPPHQSLAILSETALAWTGGQPSIKRAKLPPRINALPRSKWVWGWNNSSDGLEWVGLAMTLGFSAFSA